MPEDLKTIADRKFRETAYTELTERMDTDADLVNLLAYVFKDANDKPHKVPNAISVTLNDPAMFAWRVEAALGSAIEQVVVVSESKRFDTAYVESFVRAAFKGADKLLPKKDLYPLNPFIDQQACRRGRVATRCLFQIEKGEMVTDITPWDTRYSVYWNDKKGYAGAAYKTYRSQSQILGEYPDANVPDGTNIEVQDLWSRDLHELWAAGKMVKREKNHPGYVPLIFHKVPIGSMLLDTDSLKYQGESIFFLIRDLIPELNRLVSIIQSLNQREVDHALQMRIPKEMITQGMQAPDHDKLTDPASVTIVPSEGGIDKIPLGELRQQAQLLHKMIQDRVDEAMGKKFQNLGQPKTATEIMAIGQEQEILLAPRIATRGLLKQDLAEMFIRQVIETGESTVKIGHTTFDVAKLKGEYEIEFKYHFSDPKMDIARTSMAASQRGMIPDKAIRRDTLQREDPEEDERLLSWEKAARLSPLVDLRRTIIDLLKEADKGNEDARDEAEVMCDSQYCPMLEQTILGKALAPNEELKPSQPLVPLMAERGGTV